MKDLFGEDVKPPLIPEKGKRKPTQARGYAAPPGTGPAGETCGTCKHKTIRRFAGSFRKCLLMQRFWTRGPGSDIKARSPACKRWEAKEKTGVQREDKAAGT